MLEDQWRRLVHNKSTIASPPGLGLRLGSLRFQGVEAGSLVIAGPKRLMDAVSPGACKSYVLTGPHAPGGSTYRSVEVRNARATAVSQRR